MTVIEGDPFGPVKSATKQDSIEPGQVNRLHARDDLDSSSVAHHHTLGIKTNQASPGHHTHNRVNSKALLDGVILSGSKATYNATLMGQVVDALEKLGATDSTS